MCTIGGNAMATNFGWWIRDDQILLHKATNVIAAVRTKLNVENPYCNRVHFLKSLIVAATGGNAKTNLILITTFLFSF